MRRSTRPKQEDHAPPVAVRLGTHYRNLLMRRAEAEANGTVSDYLRPLIERHLDGEDESALRDEVEALRGEIATLRSDLAAVFEDILLNLTDATEDQVRQLVTRRLRR